MITDYLLELLDDMPLPTRRRRRILTEVEDHLTSAVAELHAAGMETEEAESEAVRRFGPAAELALGFTEQEAALAGRRVAQRSAALAALLMIVVLGPRAVVLPWANGAFPASLVAFVLAQVALVAGVLTAVRAWCAEPEGGPRGRRLSCVLRGAALVVGCAAGTVASGLADAFSSGAGLSWGPVTWIALGGLVIGITATGAGLPRSRRLATSAASPAEKIGSIPGPWTATAAPSFDQDALADIQGAAMLTLARLQRRVPPLRRALSRATPLMQTLPARLARRAPRLARWLDLRRHPWRFAASTAITAGIVLAADRAVAEGVSRHHLLGALLACGLIVTIEALAVLLGFAVLGRFLGIRPPRATTGSLP